MAIHRSTPPWPSGTARPGLGPEEGLVLHADLVGPLDDDVALGGGVAVADRHAAHDVAVGVDRVGAASASSGSTSGSSSS